MGIREAILEVLREAGDPLHSKEIAKRILAKKLWQTTGKTPHATISARLYADIKKKGNASPFIQAGPQMFGLRPGAAVPVPIGQTTSRSRARKATTRTYSFTEAAERVLEQFGNKKPMHYREITKKALEQGWLHTEGKTPDDSMGAQLYVSIKRARRRGGQPRFVQHGKGVFGLSKWMGQGLAYQIAQHNKQARQALRKRLYRMEWERFEELVGLILVEMGFEDVQVTAYRNDKGIDVRGILVVGGSVRIRMAVQVKKWGPRHNVQAPVVQQVRGSLSPHEQGLIITTSDFSKGSRDEAERKDAVPVALINGDEFAGLLVEYGISVSKRSHDIIELEDAEGQK